MRGRSWKVILRGKTDAPNGEWKVLAWSDDTRRVYLICHYCFFKPTQPCRASRNHRLHYFPTAQPASFPIDSSPYSGCSSFPSNSPR